MDRKQFVINLSAYFTGFYLSPLYAFNLKAISSSNLVVDMENPSFEVFYDLSKIVTLTTENERTSQPNR